ncbi:MAG: hypothetical protein JNG83_14730 [Opitutaceae bacterium]|nr:hypothetical protein [Opitutaceae bacterium]
MKLLVLILGGAVMLAQPSEAHAKLRAAAMSLPAELAGAERLPVTGRQGWKRVERLAYGAFRVSEVRRSLTKGGSLHIIIYDGAKARQTFGFRVAEDEGEAWRGEAETTARRRALNVGVEVEMRNRSAFGARLAPEARPEEAWLLKLGETRERPLAGTLERGGQVVTVRGTNRLAGTPLPLGETAGYVFSLADRPLAAVEVINDGAVWLAPDLPAELRGPVTSAIASLLLFEELRRTFPE